MRNTCGTILLAAFLACGISVAPIAAHAQNPLWGWGTQPAANTKWTPELFADYIGTGQTPHPAVADADVPDVIQRSSHTADPQPAPGFQPAEPAFSEVLDVRHNGQAMLTTAGGLAMAILGLRTIFGGRRGQES